MSKHRTRTLFKLKKSSMYDKLERILELPTTLSDDIYTKRLVVPILFVTISHFYVTFLRSWGMSVMRLYFCGFTLFFLASFLESSRILLLLSLVSLSFVHCKILLRWHWMPTSNFGLQLVLLMASDYYMRHSRAQSSWSLTVFHTVLMGMFVRTTTFAYDISDAFLIRNKSKKNLVAFKLHERNPSRLDYITLELFPSYWEYMSYVLFPISIMYGPHMRFSEYRKMMATRDTDERACDHSGRKARIREVIIGLAKLLSFYLLAVLYAPLGRELTTEETLASPLWKRVLLGYTSLQRHNTSYIYWYLAEYAFLTLGVGFNEATGHWDYYKNAIPEILDFSMTYGDLWIYWNISAHKFLKDYVYKRFRLYWDASPTIAGLFTYLMSAAWHGSSSGKWALFAQMILVEICFESIEPFINHSRFWWLFFIPNRLGFAYFFLPGSMTGTTALIMFRSWYYYGHVLVGIYFVTAMLLKSMNVLHKPSVEISAKLKK